MNKKIQLLLFIAIFFIVTQDVFAEKNSIKLLAINEATKEGTIVDLELEIQQGSGKVFIETYPLSQIDTQISLRIAKIIACKISERYCLDKDFVYSIKSTSPVVAGPSAGAAMTLLTIAALENKKLDPNTVITGTINSGGVVGIVGSVKEKIKAAANASLHIVLIPLGEENATELLAYGDSLKVTVIEVSDIEEAYELFTSEKILRPELIIDESYREIMKNLNKEICERTNTIKNELESYEIPKKYVNSKELGSNLSQQAKELFENGLYYSSASKCFGANVYLREALFGAKNLSKEEITEEKEKIESKLLKLEQQLNVTAITNLGNLETEMIIQERIFDARKNLEKINATDSMRELSYALERTYSAGAWRQFITFPGKPIDETNLQESCILKIEEVGELYNYVSIYMPALLQETKKELDKAKEHLTRGEYVLCLFKASKSEAEINAALSALYTEEGAIDSLVQKKIQAAAKAIQKQIQKSAFPILGYSYYEYAGVLNESDKYTSLLYAEYGIELSNLDIYFPQKKPRTFPTSSIVALIVIIVFGFILILFQKTHKKTRIVLRRKH